MVARLLWAENVSAAGGRRSEQFFGAAVGMSRLSMSRRDYGHRKRADKAGKKTDYK